MDSLRSCKKSMLETALFGGDLHSLKMRVDQLSKDEAKLATSAKVMGGLTPLVLACKHGHLDVVEYLIDECGADVELKGFIESDGISVEPSPPLLWATAAGHLNVIKCLLSRGANINCVGEFGQSALHMACGNGELEIVKCLVANGADIEAVDFSGSTCLSQALITEHYQIMIYLIQTDVNGRLIQKGLGWVGEMFTQMLLKGENVSVDFEVIMAVFVVALNAIEAKKKCGENYETADDYMVLHLIGCMTRKEPEMSDEQHKSFSDMIRRYIRLNRDELDGVTPLHLICSLHPVGRDPPYPYSAVDVVRPLLDAGADPQAVDRRLNAPLHMVAEARPISLDLIRLLLDRGAHFDARNAKGECFLDLVAPEDRALLNSFDYITLKCLAAHAVRKSNIEYQDQLPRSLVPFVKLH